MAYKVEPEPGEEVAASIELNLSKKAQPFFFAVSNRAVYIPRIKLIAKTDPYYFQRVRLEQVQQVIIRRLAPYGLWLLAGLMIIIGLVTTISMMEPVLRNEAGTHRISGWPIAVFVCGFVLPFAAKGRFGLGDPVQRREVSLEATPGRGQGIQAKDRPNYSDHSRSMRKGWCTGFGQT